MKQTWRFKVIVTGLPDINESQFRDSKRGQLAIDMVCDTLKRVPGAQEIRLKVARGWCRHPTYEPDWEVWGTCWTEVK